MARIPWNDQYINNAPGKAHVGTPAGGGSRAIVHPNRVDAHIKYQQVLQARKAGKSWQVIADEVGFSRPQQACEYYKRALQLMVARDIDECRAIELERLDDLWKIPYEVIQQQLKNMESGEVYMLPEDSIYACLKISEARRRILGLDAPIRREVKAEVTNTSAPNLDLRGLSDEELLQVQALLAKASAKQAKDASPIIINNGEDQGEVYDPTIDDEDIVED